MKQNKLTMFYCIVALVIMLIASCSKLISIDKPIDSISGDEVFKDSSSAITALNSIYIRMASNISFSTCLLNITTSLSSDDLKYAGAVGNYKEFEVNSPEDHNSYLSSLWDAPYTLIYQANSIIENTSDSKALSESLKTRLIASAKFFRSFFYFYLTNTFGEVPLVTSTDYTKTARLPKSSSDIIYNLIIKDLKDAIPNLSDDYSTTFGKAMISSWAAKALLARVYLYKQQWQNAASLSSEIIHSRIFRLEPDINKIFLANSEEAIWQLAPLDGQGFTSEGNAFVPNSELIPNYQISDTLLHSFEPGDKRKQLWVGETNVNGIAYYYPYKYKVASGPAPSSEYYVIFRLAEQYLINAEAEAEQNNLTTALNYLDSIRNRAGLPLYSNNGIDYSKEKVLSLVVRERQHELFCEWGHRWFDLKRTGMANTVLGGIKPGWTPDAIWFPIPFREVQRNPLLK